MITIRIAFSLFVIRLQLQLQMAPDIVDLTFVY